MRAEGWMYRTLIAILLIFAAALVLVGITFSASAEAPADFRFVNGTEPKSLDPHIMTGQPEGRIADALFEGLMVRDPRSLRPVPGVAEAMPEISADRTTYRFRVRKEARWSDGTPITAEDFAFSWRRLQRADLASEYAYIHHMIKWAGVFNTYEGNAKTIRETILPNLAKLRQGVAEPENVDTEVWQGLLDEMRASGAEGVPAGVWQGFLAAVHAAEALKNVDDRVLQDSLTKREGTLSNEDLDAIQEALVREGARRLESYEYADAHYGVDEGVFVDPADRYTLVVELNAPTPFFLDIVAFYSSHPVPRHVVDVRDEEGKEVNKQNWFLPDKIVGNGPWRMERWRVNEKIRLVKNENYWNADATKLDIIDAYSIESEVTGLNLYLTGAVDWLPNYPADLVDQLRTRSDFYSNPGLVVYYYRFNTTRPPLDDPKVRLAMCMAIDRQLIVDQVMRLGQLPAFHLVPPGLAGYEPPESAIRFDPEEARRLLAEAGYPDGKGLPSGSRAMGVVYNTSEAHKKVAEVIADQLRRNLGIEIAAYNQEWQAYQATMLKLDYWIARAGWIGDYLDPNTFLDMWVTNGGNNQTGWSNPVYDRLIRTAADVSILLEESESLFGEMKEPEIARGLLSAMRDATTEEARLDAGARLRMHLFREAESILVQDGFPICPIYFYVVSGMVRPYVKGFYSKLEFPDGSTGDNLQDIHPLRGMWIER